MSGSAAQLPDPEFTREITPTAVAKWIHLPPHQRPRVIDCREAEEIAICQIPGSEWLPLGDFTSRRERFTTDDDGGWVVVCHHGMRSLRGAQILRSFGLNAFSMKGGVEAWAETIDPKMPRY